MTESGSQAPEELVLEAARAIRPYLAGLLGAADSAATDEDLARALAEAATGRRVGEDILGRLRAAPATRRWWLGFRETGAPPELVPHSAPSRSAGIPGRGELVLPPRYECPSRDYVWYRSGTRPVPICPTHGVRLEATPQGH